MFKNLRWLLIFLMAVALLGGCSTKTPEAGYQTITAEEAKKMMDSGDAFVLVDVRTEAEYAEGHIPGAILIPNESINQDMPSALSDKSATILVYCRSGNRSAQASKKLADMGYTAIYDFGGIINWPYDIEK